MFGHTFLRINSAYNSKLLSYALNYAADANPFGNQTFGITSGTLNCKKTQFVMNEQTQEFVASNMDQLAKEIAIGKGEALDTLAELMAVSDKASFVASLQDNYNKIYTSQDVDVADPFIARPDSVVVPKPELDTVSHGAVVDPT